MIAVSIGVSPALAAPEVSATVPPAAPAKSGPTLAVLVLPLSSHQAAGRLAQVLDDIIGETLSEVPTLHATRLTEKSPKLPPQTRNDIRACGNYTCLADVAHASGFDRVLKGSLNRVGGEYVLALYWIDAAYGDPIAIVTESVKGEKALRDTALRATRALVNAAAYEDEPALTDPEAAQLWAASATLGVGARSAPEPYDVGLNATARFALAPGAPLGGFFYPQALVGVQGAYFSGKSAGVAGRIQYYRWQIAPLVELSGAVGVANQRRTRLYLGVGFDVSFEAYNAHQGRGLSLSGETTTPELRLLGGVTHKFSRNHSLVLGYRLRCRLNVDPGVDPVSVMVRLAPKYDMPFNHEVELGWVVQF